LDADFKIEQIGNSPDDLIPVNTPRPDYIIDLPPSEDTV
jgi:hypothetical protein